VAEPAATARHPLTTDAQRGRATTRHARGPNPIDLIAMRKLLATSLALVSLWTADAAAQLHYTVDVRDGASHTAQVTLRVDSLPAQDSIFQFAATAPGTYQTMNIGRFVRGLRATDARGREVATRQLTTNTWLVSEPRRVRQVSYQMLDTWNHPVTEFPIYPMCGTDIDTDHALLNPHALLGFPRSMQRSRVTMRLVHPAGWTVMTPLSEGRNGYEADSYDHMVDSPFLLGNTLSLATLDVTGVPVRIAVYSPSRQITAPELLEHMRGMLNAAGQFIGQLPVDRYTFLFRFTPKSPGATGAWEHSYSSTYVLPDTVLTPRYAGGITSTAAHEFFHIVTPLNIHSEIVEHFNFETPTPSQHLWLYESVTEWASDKMQQEGGLMPVNSYLAEMATKLYVDRMYFDSTYSLAKIAETSFTTEGAKQFGNVYMRGAVIAALLDIRLLQLSGGRTGLRHLVRGLARDYGKSRPFPEDSLFQIIAARTSPEILDFFDRYVKGAERLPVREYYGLLGIDLVEGERPNLVLNPNPTPEQLRLREAWLRSGTAAATSTSTGDGLVSSATWTHTPGWLGAVASPAPATAGR
jgi:predicted metalloprotease with PDZ domain